MWFAVVLCGAVSLPPRAAVRMAAPQYTAQAAAVVASQPVSPNGASWLLSLRGLESVVAYRPGHVLAIEVSAGEGAALLKGPYTVTRANADQGTVDVIYRVIIDGGAAEAGDHVEAGPLRKTAAFKALKPGDEGVRFGGEFKVPILDGVSGGAAHVVLISSGAGVGPCLGFIEQCVAAWSAGAPCAAPSVSLFAGFRFAEDMICGDELDALATASAGQFKWTACLSGPPQPPPPPISACHDTVAGRTTVAAPPAIREELAARAVAIRETHFHLVGNGQMVSEWKEALLHSVGEERITTEMYFGHKTPARRGAIDEIVAGLSGSQTPVGAPVGAASAA